LRMVDVYTALPTVATMLMMAVPMIVPATPKKEATTAADTEAKAEAVICAGLNVGPARNGWAMRWLGAASTGRC